MSSKLEESYEEVNLNQIDPIPVIIFHVGLLFLWLKETWPILLFLNRILMLTGHFKLGYKMPRPAALLTLKVNNN